MLTMKMAGKDIGERLLRERTGYILVVRKKDGEMIRNKISWKEGDTAHV